MNSLNHYCERDSSRGRRAIRELSQRRDKSRIEVLKAWGELERTEAKYVETLASALHKLAHDLAHAITHRWKATPRRITSRPMLAVMGPN